MTKIFEWKLVTKRVNLPRGQQYPVFVSSVLDEDAIVEEIIQQEKQMVKLQKKERIKFERFSGKQHNCVLVILFAILIIAAMSVVLTLHGNKLSAVDLMDVGTLLHKVV